MIHRLETERLLLKDYTIEDLEGLHQLKSDPLVWKYSTQTVINDIEESKTCLESIIKKYGENKPNFQGLFRKDSLEYIGEAGVISFNQRNNKAVVGYNLLPAYWRRGYATEITQALIRYLFEEEKVERVEALVVEGNEASRKVLEKSGFVKEGLMRNYTFIDNRYCNVYFYGIIQSDYQRVYQAREER